jgi:chromosome segregation ATPase
MTWARQAFDELILPATSVSSLVKDSFRFCNLLEAAHKSAEDRAISAETAAAAAAAERDSLASRLALAEAEIEKPRAAAASMEEAAERAKTAAATAETTAREASQATACEKATLEAKVLELESDLRTATTDLATTGRQFSQVTNQLQVATEEASRLQDSNAKLSQDLEGKSDDPLVLV